MAVLEFVFTFVRKKSTNNLKNTIDYGIWWGSLDPFMQTLWGIAIFASVVFIIQSVMTFVGMDSETNFDGDFDGDMSADGTGEATPFQLFTFRNLINFLLGFSWTAIALRASTENTSLILVGGVVVGVLLVAAVMYLFKWMSGMQQSGTIEPEALVGCKGAVYHPGRTHGRR